MLSFSLNVIFCDSIIERGPWSSYESTWFICGSSLPKLFGRRSWSSSQKKIPWLTWLSQSTILENHLGVALSLKAFLLESICVKNELFWNFELKRIIDHKIMPTVIETDIYQEVAFFSAKYLIRWKKKDIYHHRFLRYTRLNWETFILL